MRHRQIHKRPDQPRDGSKFFARPGRQNEAPTTTAFFPRAAQAAGKDREKEQASQSIEDRDLARQSKREEDRAAQETERRGDEATAQEGEREEKTAAQETGKREEETASQAGKREEETAAQEPEKREKEEQASQEAEREDKTAAQDEREKMTSQEAERREEPVPAQAVVAAYRRRPSAHPRQVAAPAIQRTLGDGHDLTAPRFSGDRRLEAAYDDERYVRRGSRGDHVVRLQQALVELGFQLPGHGVDGIFGSETEQAVRDYQAANGLRIDGIVGPETMGDLDSRLFVPSIPLATSLRDEVRQRIARGEGYAQLRPVIRNASFFERLFALLDTAFLREIQASLAWNDFARIVELLGRRAPDGNALRANAAVQAALADAWTDSNPAVTSWDVDRPAHPSNAACGPGHSPLPRGAQTGTHEEGGWIYLNVVTGGIYTRRAAAGGQAALTLNNPPQVLDSIVVGAFHTHPNLGACWGAQPGQADSNFAQFVGVPLLARGDVGGAQQDFVTPPPAPQRRAHLAGPRGFPLAGGAIAPQRRARAAQNVARRARQAERSVSP